MLLGLSVDEVVAEVGGKGTTWAQLRAFLSPRGWISKSRLTRAPLGQLIFTDHIAMCRVRWNHKPGDRRAHWVLWAEGRWHDPLAPGARPLFARADDGRVLSYALLSKPEPYHELI